MKRFLATVALASTKDPGSIRDWPYVGADEEGTNSGTSRIRGMRDE